MREPSRKKRPISRVLTAALLGLLTLGGASQSLQAQANPTAHWRAGLIPASFNKDKTVRLIAGHTQALDMLLQASDLARKSGGPYTVEVTLDLPQGFEVIDARGVHVVQSTESIVTANDRVRYKATATVHDGLLAGAFNGRWESEWRTLTFFLKTPQDLPAGAGYLRVTIRQGDLVMQDRWPMKLETLTPVASKPKRAVFGLWDYNHGRVTVEDSGVPTFLAATGLNFTQLAGEPFWREAHKVGVTVGGDVHHDLFYGGSALTELDVNGNPVNGFSNAARILQQPEDTPLAGVKHMVEHASKFDGMATYDYEPIGVGFTPEALAQFKKECKISDEDCDAFLAFHRKHGRNIYVQDDARMVGIYRQWVAFHSRLCAAYVARLSKQARAIKPDIRIAMTPNAGYSDTDPTSLGQGYNAAAFAPHVDVIMPQLYNGYGGAAVKLTMDYARHWQQVMEKTAPKTQLWPILLVRHNGASVFNRPERVRQQIIGVLAEGAEGFLLYYTSQLDAPYWNMLARTAEDVAKYEDFYLDGKRVDNQFPLSNMVKGETEIAVWPAHRDKVIDPQWAFTAHELDGKVLLTLFNLEDGSDSLFTVAVPEGMKVVQTQGIAETYGQGQWLVSPFNVGFVILEKTNP